MVVRREIKIKIEGMVVWNKNENENNSKECKKWKEKKLEGPKEGELRREFTP